MIYVWSLTSFTHTVCDTDPKSWCGELRMNKSQIEEYSADRTKHVRLALWERENVMLLWKQLHFQIIIFLSVFFSFNVNLCICVCTDMYLGTVKSCVVIPAMFFSEYTQSHMYGTDLTLTFQTNEKKVLNWF